MCNEAESDPLRSLGLFRLYRHLLPPLLILTLLCGCSDGPPETTESIDSVRPQNPADEFTAIAEQLHSAPDRVL